MQLIGSYTSPFVRKIRVLLIEKGVPYSFLEDNPWTPETKTTQFNPLGKVPILIDENGSTWYDSNVIAEYIESLNTRVKLLPDAHQPRLEVKQLIALVEGIVEAGIAIFLEQKRSQEKQDQDWIERNQLKTHRGLDALEKALGDNLWLHENQFSLADICAGVVLGWLSFRLPDIDWKSGRPYLEAFATRLFARESFQKTQPPAQ